MSQIWIPTARGAVDVRTWRVNLALKDYDERLSVGRNEDTGDWCVYIKMPPGGDWPEQFPVLALGPEMPSTHEVMERLRRADTVRNGDKILRDLKESDERRERESRKKMSEAAGIAAEVFDFAHRKTGTAPYHKSMRRVRQSPGEYW